MTLAALAALALAGCSGARSGSGAAGSAAQGAAFDGAEVPAAPQAPQFTLTGQRGASVSLSRYRGRVLVLGFVYTTCGGTCVLVAQQIRGALDELARPVPVLLVSALPASDTPARIARFLASVGLTGRAEYLSGPAAQLREVWRAYGVTPPERDAAIFKRDETVLLIDARGRERVAYGLEQLAPEALAHDIRLLERG